MKTIKVKTYHNEVTNRATYTTFTIVPYLPDIGDEIGYCVVTEIKPAHVDIDAYISDRNCEFDYYIVKSIDPTDDEVDPFYDYFAVEKECVSNS